MPCTSALFFSFPRVERPLLASGSEAESGEAQFDHFSFFPEMTTSEACCRRLTRNPWVAGVAGVAGVRRPSEAMTQCATLRHRARPWEKEALPGGGRVARCRRWVSWAEPKEKRTPYGSPKKKERQIHRLVVIILWLLVKKKKKEKKDCVCNHGLRMDKLYLDVCVCV